MRPVRPAATVARVVQCGAESHHRAPAFTPRPAMTDRVRLTISVPKEAHEVFTRMAEAAGQSVGRVMGDWLQDTIEGAQFVTQKMVEARQSPKTVMREFQAMARGLVDAVDEHAESMRRAGWRNGMRAEPAPGPTARATPIPPSSPTGGKSPGKGGPTTWEDINRMSAPEFAAHMLKTTKAKGKVKGKKA